jgi:ActR/RegA family two-component response regulator
VAKNPRGTEKQKFQSRYALVVEPDEKYAFLFQRYVEMIGYQAETFEEIPAALREFKAELPAFIICDSSSLQDGDWKDLELFRQAADNQVRPVLVCHWGHEMVPQFVEYKPIELLEKPVGFADFIKALKRLGVLQAEWK